MQRTSHALPVDGRVWLVDPVDAPELEERVRALGEPAGVLQLLDRHERGCAAWARRLGVPHLRAWESVGVAVRGAADSRPALVARGCAVGAGGATLVCADALGTVPFFRAPGERIGLHPLIRPFPPRALAGSRRRGSSAVTARGWPTMRPGRSARRCARAAAPAGGVAQRARGRLPNPE